MTENRTTSETLSAMLHKSWEKLQAAKTDMDNEFFGDAASRAYYAVFHAISAVLAEQGLSFSSHAQTLGAFNREFVKTGIFPPHSYRILQRLFEDRQLGDYDWSRDLDKETAENDVRDAESLISICIKHLEEKTGFIFQPKRNK